MSKVELLVLFVDGLDYDFVLRNLEQADELRRLFPPEQIHQVEGVVHSLDCFGQIFAGRPYSLFQFQGHQAIPETDQIINWDALLAHVPAEELLWNRLNRCGHPVGLVEMLGVFLSPRLDGFSVTKGLGPIGLQGLFQQGLTHYPRAAGDLFFRLCEEHGYARQPGRCVMPAAELVNKALTKLTLKESREVIEAAGCHRLPGIMDDNLDRLCWILEGMTERFPVDALMLHTGYFDILLHLFFNSPDLETRITASLDQMLGRLGQALSPEEILIFSDHGMALSPPHLAHEFLHLTCHRQDNAVVMGSGPRVARYLEENPPRDLTAVYNAALATFDAGPARTEPPTVEEMAAQQQALLLDRDQLIARLSSLIEKVEE